MRVNNGAAKAFERDLTELCHEKESNLFLSAKIERITVENLFHFKSNWLNNEVDAERSFMSSV